MSYVLLIGVLPIEVTFFPTAANPMGSLATATSIATTSLPPPPPTPPPPLPLTAISLAQSAADRFVHIWPPIASTNKPEETSQMVYRRHLYCTHRHTNVRETNLTKVCLPANPRYGARSNVKSELDRGRMSSATKDSTLYVLHYDSAIETTVECECGVGRRFTSVVRNRVVKKDVTCINM
jgi:hypothetical protein